MTNTTTATGTLKIDRTTLEVVFAPEKLEGYVHTYTITVRHPEGGEAVYEVQNYRGFVAHERGNESPINVHQAVLALVKRMDVDYQGSISGEIFDPAASFARALAS